MIVAWHFEEISGSGLFRDDEGMAFALRKNIHEGKGDLVFIEFYAWDVALDDSGEDIVVFIGSVEAHGFNPLTF